ncbi:unnamed protein product [Clonostachys solani]|uniref:Uncharacterized protein n=1 Tax=Clonostachys solani TaxID=160281 RepID=A0A9N9W1W0_9HYPO|nr:unnamed protein product [Clonostachys solani]
MQRIKSFLYECVSFVAFLASPYIEGNTPEFEADREKWQETCTRDLVLADFTKYLQHGHTYPGRVLNKTESWDQESLESYLLTQLPQEGDYKMLLRNCMPSLWALTIYFAQWPFNTSPGLTTRLTFPAFVRAIAFLCGRHNRMIVNWEGQDQVFNHTTDQIVLEYIFRALATTRPSERQPRSAPPPQETAKLSSHRDVLDILSVSQPFLNHRTENLTRAELVPTADRLSPPTPPELSELIIPATGERLREILELAIPLLQHASQFENNTSCSASVKEQLEAARTKLETQEEVTFDVFRECLDCEDWMKKYHDVNPIYDGIALLFNTFPNPESLTTGKTANWYSGSEESLRLDSLRQLGLRTVTEGDI